MDSPANVDPRFRRPWGALTGSGGPNGNSFARLVTSADKWAERAKVSCTSLTAAGASSGAGGAIFSLDWR